MIQKLTRRQFGQLAIAGTAVTAIATLANKTAAQKSNLVIYGARSVRKNRRIVLQSLNVTTGVVQDLTTVNLESGEKLTVFTSLTDGRFVLVISPIRASNKENDPPRLVFVGGPSANNPLNISGLKPQDTFESLLGTNDGSLYGLVMKKNSRPPINLVAVDRNTGEISLVDNIKLPQTYRFSNLAQCLNGTIYTTTVGQLGETSLVQLDLGQGKPILRAQLKFKSQVWNSGLSDLVCSPSGQLFALGAPRYETINCLYKIEPYTGAMTLLKEFNVHKIAFSH